MLSVHGSWPYSFPVLKTNSTLLIHRQISFTIFPIVFWLLKSHHREGLRILHTRGSTKTFSSSHLSMWIARGKEFVIWTSSGNAVTISPNRLSILLFTKNQPALIAFNRNLNCSAISRYSYKLRQQRGTPTRPLPRPPYLISLSIPTVLFRSMRPVIIHPLHWIVPNFQASFPKWLLDSHALFCPVCWSKISNLSSP